MSGPPESPGQVSIAPPPAQTIAVGSMFEPQLDANGYRDECRRSRCSGNGYDRRDVHADGYRHR
jgi:hypothetical protein